jgi:hypothetical protein
MNHQKYTEGYNSDRFNFTLFNGVLANSDHIASNAWMIVSKKLEKMYEEAVVV